MPRYHLYYIRQGMFVDSEDVEASDENEAAQVARSRNEGDTAEIWSDERRLRVVGSSRMAAEVPAE